MHWTYIEGVQLEAETVEGSVQTTVVLTHAVEVLAQNSRIQARRLRNATETTNQLVNRHLNVFTLEVGLSAVYPDDGLPSVGRNGVAGGILGEQGCTLQSLLLDLLGRKASTCASSAWSSSCGWDASD